MFEFKNRLLILSLIGLAIWSLYLCSYPLVLVHPDSAKYANIASNFYENKHFSIDIWYPAWFNYASIQKDKPWPSLYPCLYPFIINSFFFLLGVKDLSVILSSSIFFLLSIPLFYLLAQKIFGEKTAFFSTLVFITQPQMLFYSKSGLSESMFIFFILAGFLVLYSAKGIWHFFSAGLIFGFSIATRNVGFIYVLSGAFFLYRVYKNDSRLKKMCSFFSGIFLGIFALQILFANLILAKPPFSIVYAPLFHTSRIFPYDTLMRSFDRIDLNFIFAHFNHLLIKAWDSLKYIYYSIFFFPSNIEFPLYQEYYSFFPFLLFLYLLGLLRRFEEDRKKAFKLAIVLLITTNLFFHLFTIPEMRYLHPVLPFMIIFGAEFLLFILKELSSLRQAVCLVFLFGFCIILPQSLVMLEGNFYYQNFRYATQYQILSKVLEKNTQPQDIVLTNIDSWGSWYGKRRTIFLPKRQDFNKLCQYIDIDVIFLAAYPCGEICNVGVLPADWQDLLKSPKDFGDFQYVFTQRVPVFEVETLRLINTEVVLYRKKK